MNALHKLATLSLAATSMMAGIVDSANATTSISDFVKHPVYSTARISPNGEYLAISVDQGDQDVLTILRTKDLSPVKINVLPDKKSVGAFYWTSPDRLMFNAVIKIGSYERPRATGEWFAVNADGSQPRTLIEYGTQNATQRSKSVGNEAFSMLDTLRDDDTNVVMLVRYPRSSTGAGTEVVMVDTLSGRRKSLGRAPRENCSLALGPDKQPLYAACYDDKDETNGYDASNEVYQRGADGKWSLISASKADGKFLDIERSAANGKIYATQSDGKGPAAFGLLNPTDGSFTELFHDDVSEISDMIEAADNSEAIIGVVTEAGAPKVTMIDEAHPDAVLYQSLAMSFPGQFVDFSSATLDGQKIIVSVRSDTNPGELYMFDRGTNRARFLMKSRPWIDPKQMSDMKPLSFRTRDGMTLHAYLTLPKGSDGKNLPMIVNVHGGPMGPRDNWGFDNEAQMFASRGYATLQINYRGSGGFGKAFRDMAYGQWAEGIMNDIIDGTRFVIDQGYADGKRVCIYGGSFGGYASMMAPARNPDLFACAFGYVGAYDAQVQMTKSDTSKSESGMRYLLRALGSTRAERDAMSPVNHASQIKLPVYLAAGARDQRCPPENTEAMAKALTSAGNPPEGVIIQSGEEHGFYKEENNLNLYTKMLSFFDKHIGGKVDVGVPASAN